MKLIPVLLKTAKIVDLMKEFYKKSFQEKLHAISFPANFEFNDCYNLLAVRFETSLSIAGKPSAGRPKCIF